MARKILSIYIVVLSFVGVTVSAASDSTQVETKEAVKGAGINTQDPQTTLDVNGNGNFSGPIMLPLPEGGVNKEGVRGQVLASQGSELAPEWKTVPDAVVNGGSMLTYSGAYKIQRDQEGHNIVKNQSGRHDFKFDESIDGGSWELKIFDGEGVDFSIQNSNINQMDVVFQTVAQEQSVSVHEYACGLFIDKKLKVVRESTLDGSGPGSFEEITLTGVIENIELGDHKLQVACQRISTKDKKVDFSIGGFVKVRGGNNLAGFATQSTVSYNIFEKAYNATTEEMRNRALGKSNSKQGKKSK